MSTNTEIIEALNEAGATFAIDLASWLDSSDEALALEDAYQQAAIDLGLKSIYIGSNDPDLRRIDAAFTEVVAAHFDIDIESGEARDKAAEVAESIMLELQLDVDAARRD